MHHILQQPENSRLFKFFLSQMKSPRQGDWVTQVLSDLNQLEIELSLEEIQVMSFDKYNSILKRKIGNLAFLWLMEKKNSRTSENAKGKKLKYSELKMAEYLYSAEIDISTEERKWIFQCRVEDINVKGNRKWQNEDIECLSCNLNFDETQSHILSCKALLEKSQIITYIPTYSELFGNNLEEITYVSRVLHDNHRRRVAERPM